jgi:hypothetical protein
MPKSERHHENEAIQKKSICLYAQANIKCPFQTNERLSNNAITKHSCSKQAKSQYWDIAIRLKYGGINR